jgi:hypothetical protein
VARGLARETTPAGLEKQQPPPDRRDAIAQGGPASFVNTGEGSATARRPDLMRVMQLRGVVLVEGTSDRRAVETLARRRGRDLQAEGVAIVAMGGYGNLPRLLAQYRDVRLAGLYDVGEERHFLRALGCDDRGELERVGFYACTRDLEDELTRAMGPDGMERALAEQGELRAFRTYQKQPAHRARPLEEQLHGFMWNRKQKYAVLLVETLDLERVPRPLDRVLAHV